MDEDFIQYIDEKFVILNGNKLKIKDNRLIISHLNLSEIQEVENIRECEFVTALTINKCRLESMKIIKYFPKLEELDLKRNNIKSMSNLDKVPNLRKLNLSYNKISIIQNLEMCENLLKLSLAGNKISKIENLDALDKLEDLNLSQNQITDIENLVSLRNLKTLSLSGNEGIKILQNLEHNRKLEDLNLYGSYLQDISGLQSNTDLKRLILDLSSKDFEIQGLEVLNHLELLELHVIGINSFNLPSEKFIKLLRFACIIKKELYSIEDWKALYREFPDLFYSFIHQNSYHKINWYLSQCRNIAKILPKYVEDVKKIVLTEDLRFRWKESIERIERFLKESPKIVSLKEVQEEETSVLNEVYD